MEGDAMNYKTWLAPVAIMVLTGVVVILNHFYKDSALPELKAQCADLRAGCEAMLGDRRVAFGVDGELRMLKPFELWVRVKGVDKVQASFDMQGMDMGFNLYTLRADGSGAYRARITLPMCVSGRHEWLLHLDIDRRRITVPFVTGM
jgi:hypothetical protein